MIVQFPIVLLVIITGTPPSLKLLLLITSLLFLNQLMKVCGLPVAVQVKLTSSPDLTVVFVGGSIMTGKTVMKGNKMNQQGYMQGYMCVTRAEVKQKIHVHTIMMEVCVQKISTWHPYSLDHTQIHATKSYQKHSEASILPLAQWQHKSPSS